DTLYGNESLLIDRQALHCYEMKFKHPITNKELKITCPMPEDMKRVIEGR
ncbi:MAG: RluA family pseudouridine synthase, partial [Tissierellia bacterium]|nr:RluA family pseudouridine synthase [Tissierellia bacterium]